MLDLGSVVASIDLNSSSFVSNAQKAKTAADSLNGAGSGAMVQAESRLDAFGAKLDAISEKLIGFGTKMTAAVTLPIVGAFGLAFNSAASFEQAIGKTEAVYGDASAGIIKWSEDSATAFGMSQTEALNMVGTYGQIMQAQGMSQDVSADYSKSLIGLAADMSAFTDVSQDRTTLALQSALTGEYESMKQFGVVLKADQVEQEALNIAIANGRGEVTEADRVQARYNLIMAQTSQMQGQFAREADGASGMMSIFKAQIKDTAANFGRLLLPAGTKALRWVSDFLKRIDNLSDTQKKWVLGIAAAAAAIGPLVAVIGFLLSPIGLVVVAIAALAAGAIYAYTHFEPFREAVDKVASALKDFATGAIEKVIAAWEKLKAAFDAGGWSEVFSTLGDMLLNGLQELSDTILTGAQALGVAFWDGVQAVDWGGLLSAAWDVFLGAHIWLIQKLGDLAGALWGWFSTAVTTTDWAGVLSTAWDVLSGAGLWILGKLGDLAVSLGAWFYQQVTGVPWQALFQLAINVLINVGAWIIAAIGDLTQILIPAGQQAVSGLWNGAMIAWAWVSAWLATIGTLAIAAVGVLTGTLVARGKELFTGFWNGILTAWASVSAWLGTVSTLVYNAVGSLTGSLSARGVQVMTGLWNGMLSMWAGVSGWLSGLGGLIAGAVGDMSGALVGAGLSIMSGLKSGLVSGWNDITGWLSGLNPADWKGPEARDRKMLYKPGLWIMDGLSRGLDEGWQDVTRQLAGFRPELALSAASVSTPSVSGYRSMGAASVPAYAYAAPRGATIAHTYTFGDINITQQPGEDGEALATRIFGYLNESLRTAPTGGR